MPTEQGNFFEDLRPGQKIHHGLGRTVTDVDNIWFSLLTCNSNQLHFNVDYAKRFFGEEPFNGRLAVKAYLALAIVVGLSVNETSRNGVMLGQSDFKMTRPVFAGDTLYEETAVLSKRLSKSHPAMGVVEIKTVGYNQRKEKVLEFDRSILLRRRGRKWR